jgi:hypothetical protein
MFRRTALMTLAMVASLAVPALAQVKLEYKYPEETSAQYRTTSKVHQILTIVGMDIETDADTTFVSSHSVGKKNADGTVPVTVKIDSLRSQIDLPGGNSVTFDSANPDAKIENPQLAFLGDVYKIVVGMVYTVILDDKGQVKAVEGTEKTLAKLEGLDPKVASILKGRLETDSIKREFVKTHASLPDILVRQGEPWERTETDDIGGGQTLTFKRRYEYQGTVQKEGRTLDKISVKALEVTYAMDPEIESPLKHEKSDLKIDSSDGTILFDREAGQMVERSGKTRIKGDMTFKAGEMELPSKLDLTLDITSVMEPASK